MGWIDWPDASRIAASSQVSVIKALHAIAEH
jgi:hypothetical protein